MDGENEELWNRVLWRTDLQGSKPVQMTSAEMKISSPQWHPTLAQMAFIIYDIPDKNKPEEKVRYLAIMDPEKPMVIQEKILLRKYSNTVADPEVNGLGRYSPDGRYIMCGYADAGGIIDLKEKRITKTIEPEVTARNYSEYRTAVADFWLPDSSAYLLTISGISPATGLETTELWYFNLNGESRRLARGLSIWFATPDGKKMLFTDGKQFFFGELSKILPAINPNCLLLDGDGKKVTIADFRGKPALFVMWASWCGNCDLKELSTYYKSLQEEQEKADKPLNIIFISLDSDKQSTIKKFAEARMDVPLLFIDNKDELPFGRIRDIPSSYLLSADGEILQTFTGNYSATDLKVQVRQLLQEGFEL